MSESIPHIYMYFLVDHIIAIQIVGHTIFRELHIQ